MSCFTLMVIGLSFVFGWLWMKTKSPHNINSLSHSAFTHWTGVRCQLFDLLREQSLQRL